MVLIDWPREFEAYWGHLEAKAKSDDEFARSELDFMFAELDVLAKLDAEPVSDSASLKSVRQSKQHPVWRVFHPFHDRKAMRLIVWFPPDEPDTAVVALLAANKAQMGDVFYNCVGTRADDLINKWIYQKGQGREQTRVRPRQRPTGEALADPATRKRVDAIQAEMAQVDREHAMHLASIRKARSDPGRDGRAHGHQAVRHQRARRP